MPIYINYSESEIKRVVTTIINKSVSEIDFDNQLFIINKDNNLVTLDYDPAIVNRIISNIGDKVYNNLKLIEKLDNNILNKYNIDKSIFFIPSGIVFNSILLNNLGPRIPIRLELIGSVNPNLETKLTEYGINNSLIEVSIRINTSVKMILPFSSKELKIIVVVPLTVKIIQGEVPEYYFGYNKTRSS